MKKTVIIFLGLIVMVAVRLIGAPEFGTDGLDGLSPAQKQQLETGQIVFSTVGSISTSKSELIHASIVFNKSLDETWGLISRTEDQIKYLSDIRFGIPGCF
jgi:hypothetical protein